VLVEPRVNVRVRQVRPVYVQHADHLLVPNVTLLPHPRGRQTAAVSTDRAYTGTLDGSGTIRM
jgi:hypothetical protein